MIMPLESTATRFLSVLERDDCKSVWELLEDYECDSTGDSKYVAFCIMMCFETFSGV